MGGEYDYLFLDEPPPQDHTGRTYRAVASGAEGSGREHQLQLAVLGELGNTIAAGERIALSFERPPTLSDGESQRVMLAPLGGPVQFPSYGRLFLHVTFDGMACKTVPRSVLEREASSQARMGPDAGLTGDPVG